MAILALLASSTALAERPADIPVWGDHLPQGFTRAREHAKPLLLLVENSWAPSCQLFERTTLRDSRVVTQLGSLVLVRLDADDHPELTLRLRAGSHPTLLVFDGAERELARFAGPVAAERLAPVLEHLNARYSEYLTRRHGADTAENRLWLGRFLEKAGHFDAAAIELKRSWQLARKAGTPKTASIELEYARAASAAGRHRGAIKSLRRLSAREEDRRLAARALRELVLAERRRGRTEEARRALTRLRTLDPELAKGL